MTNLTNIERSAFTPGAYVGYGKGAIWTITRSGRDWLAIPRQSDSPESVKHLRLRYPSLWALSVCLSA